MLILFINNQYIYKILPLNFLLRICFLFNNTVDTSKHNEELFTHIFYTGISSLIAQLVEHIAQYYHVPVSQILAF